MYAKRSREIIAFLTRFPKSEPYDNQKTKTEERKMRVSDMYNSIKDLLEVNVISEKYNRDLLENTKHRVLGDIAIVYFINADNRDLGEVMKAIPVLNAISIKQIENDALLNSMTRNPAVIKSMDSEIESIIGTQIPKDEATSMMYIASVPSKKFGACVLAYPGFFEQAAATVGGSYYVIPSSVHELILVKDSGDLCDDGINELKNEIELINRTVHAREDILSDNLYHYDAESQKFEVVEDYIRRTRE